MEILATTFIKYGYQFTQVRREGKIAIYHQTNIDNGSHMGYEVFEIQDYPDQLVGPKKVPKPAREARPGSESWGRLGFTCHTIENATKRFIELQIKLANRISKKLGKK